MKELLNERVRMPDYALPYLINNNSSNLSEEDKELIDKFMTYYYKIACLNNTSVIISPVVDLTTDNYQEVYFTSHPAFGLACNVIECDIIILVEWIKYAKSFIYRIMINIIIKLYSRMILFSLRLYFVL